MTYTRSFPPVPADRGEVVVHESSATPRPMIFLAVREHDLVATGQLSIHAARDVRDTIDRAINGHRLIDGHRFGLESLCNNVRLLSGAVQRGQAAGWSDSDFRAAIVPVMANLQQCVDDVEGRLIR